MGLFLRCYPLGFHGGERGEMGKWGIKAKGKRMEKAKLYCIGSFVSKDQSPRICRLTRKCNDAGRYL